MSDLRVFPKKPSAVGLASVSFARTIAAAKSLFGFCLRIGHLPANPSAELALARYGHRLSERILSEPEVQQVLDRAITVRTVSTESLAFEFLKSAISDCEI